MRYLISYDLVAQKDYQPLWDALNELGAVRVLYSDWTVVRTGTSPLDIAKYLVQFMDNDDRLLVTEMPGDYAYRNLLADPKAA